MQALNLIDRLTVVRRMLSCHVDSGVMYDSYDAAYADLEDYALLVLATDTPIDRAITYLKDTGSPLHARGRLLLRAAERALRAAGEVEGEEV